MSLKQRIAQQTAGLRSTSDVADSEVAHVPRTPKTGPGALGALQEARSRIEELERTKSGTSQIPVDSLEPNPWQPRKRFAAEAMDELANGIREAGLIQPIVVRKHPTIEGRYQIVAGERRWRAHKMLGLTEIKAHVVDLNDASMALNAMLENMNREDLTDFEISISVARIEEEFPSRKAASEALGISKSQMQRLASFRKLPDWVRADLQDRPELLGANASAAVVAVLAEHPDNGAAALEELWTLVKQGEMEQTKLAAHLTDKLNKKPARVSTSHHMRSFYSQGAKAGYLTRDSQNFVLRLRTSVLTEDQEKEMYAFLDKIFPQS